MSLTFVRRLPSGRWHWMCNVEPDMDFWCAVAATGRFDTREEATSAALSHLQHHDPTTRALVFTAALVTEGARP